MREQEAVILYSILKGYKLNAGAIIKNSIIKNHEGNKRGMIPHPATITWLCLRAGVKGDWAEEEECPNASPLTLTGVSKGPRNQKKKGVIVETESRDEEENARQEEDNLMVEDQEEPNPGTQPEGNIPMFTEDMEVNDRSPIDFTTPPGQFSPNEKHGFQRTKRKLQRSPGK